MSYLLLTDHKVCPSCHFKTTPPPQHFHECNNCGTLLFLRQIDFTAYEADGGFRHYWLFTKDRGWAHRDHIMEKRAAALIREQKIETPEPNNKITPEKIQARSGKVRVKDVLATAPLRK